MPHSIYIDEAFEKRSLSQTLIAHTHSLAQLTSNIRCKRAILFIYKITIKYLLVLTWHHFTISIIINFQFLKSLVCTGWNTPFSDENFASLFPISPKFIEEIEWSNRRLVGKAWKIRITSVRDGTIDRLQPFLYFFPSVFSLSFPLHAVTFVSGNSVRIPRGSPVTFAAIA